MTMELNAEINRTFGEEMAKLFAATISEDELMKKANSIWFDMNQPEYRYNERKDTDIERYVKNQILERLHGKIKEILKEPVNEELLEKRAREMLEEARKVAEEAIVKDLARHMTNDALSVYNVRDDIVNEVMRRLSVQSGNPGIY